MKMIILFLLIAGLYACGGRNSTSIPVGEEASAFQAERIDTPFRTGLHTTSGGAFPTTVLSNKTELDTFKSDTETSWNQSQDFWTALQTTEINFDTHNIVLFSFYEGSGSIIVTPQAPMISDNAIHIGIDRFVPNGGTADVAYYLLAYKISKTINQIHFDYKETDRIYNNLSGSYSQPLNCQELEWCKDKPAPFAVKQMDIPFREHGYRNFNTVILSTQESLNSFTKTGLSEDGWNDKESFINGLLKAQVNFNEYNLLIYRMTEGSGSIQLQAQAPEINDGIVTIDISRVAPSIGTTDMAYYALAYQMKKTITEVHFTGGKHDEIIKNSAGENIAPLNCNNWFDGCNTCIRGEGDAIGCTKKFCDVIDTLYCNTWE